MSSSSSSYTSVVPDSLLLHFFEECTKDILNINCSKECNWGDDKTNYPSLSDCRKLLLDKQRSCLNRIVFQYNNEQRKKQQQQQQKNNNQDYNILLVEDHMVQQRLGTLKQDVTCTKEIQFAMKQMDEAARLSLCRMALYCQCHLSLYNDNNNINNNNNNNNNDKTTTQQQEEENLVLISSGKLERSKLLEFIALNQTAIKLSIVQKHLIDSSPLFDDLPTSSKTTETTTTTTTNSSPSISQFPQTRLQRIQELLSQAVGIHPNFMKSELKRIFVLEQPNQQQQQHGEQLSSIPGFSPNNNTTSEYSNDKEVLDLFQQMVTQINVAIMNASLQSSEQALLSDQNQGGVTRVVSVNYSEFQQPIDNNNNNKQQQLPITTSTNNYGIAPKSETMIQDDIDRTKDNEERQKQQLRLASQASQLQQVLLGELFSLSEYERNNKLEQAKHVHDTVMEHLETLSSGSDRVHYLVNELDPNTSKLLSIHKLWTSMLQANGGQPPKMAK